MRIDESSYLQYKFIEMYDNLQEVITHKRFTPISRPYPSAHFQDPNAVEPWQKNTLQMEIKQQPSTRQVKTFYQTSPRQDDHRHLTTIRGFSFRKQQTINSFRKPKSITVVSRKSAISHYNITGNILGEQLRQEPQFPSFQLQNSKRIRAFKQKDRSLSKGAQHFESTPACESVNAMKRRISQTRDNKNKGFVRLNSQNNQQTPKINLNRRKSKIISLGFQKLSHFKGMMKQRSLQIGLKDLAL